MDLGHWIIPLILLVLIGGYAFGRNFASLFNLKTKTSKRIFLIIIYVILLVAILTRSVIAAFCVFALIISGIYYIFVLVFKHFKLFKCKRILEKIYLNGLTAFIISALMVAYGVWNVYHPITKYNDIKISDTLKEDGKIAYISDVHYGTFNNGKLIDDIIFKVNENNVDVFLIIGDLYDEFSSDDEIEEVINKLAKAQTKYGIFYVEGNHDLLTDKVKDIFDKNNISVLEDESVLINDNYYLVGRKDYRRNKMKDYAKRETLDNLLENLDKSKPIILLDHQPITKESKENEYVDLQLSGHTHGGQVFPGNLVVKSGYFKFDNNMQLLISPGFGAWGIGIRTTGRCQMEIVNIHN